MTTSLASVAKKIIKNRSVVRRGRDSFVVLPLDQWERIEDMLRERTSPMLLKSIAAGRRAHKRGHSIPYTRARELLGLS